MIKQYYDFYSFWMNHIDKMFIQSDEYDLFIKHQYHDLLLEHENPHYFIENDNVILLSKIILCDQVSRHIYRNNIDKIKIFDKNALRYLRDNQIFDKILNFKPTERILLCLPYSHANDYHKLMYVLSLVKIWFRQDSYNIYERFIKARCQKIVRSYNHSILSNIEFTYYSNIDNDIYDPESVKNTFSMKEYDDSIFTYFIESMKNIDISNKKIVISLSAGVDSNVLLGLMVKYIRHKKITCNLSCLILDYQNRKDQFEEIKIAHNLCSYWKVPLYRRTIKEIQRDTLSDRLFYENYTKDVKFDLYKQLGEIAFLGHHKDDIFENIMNNIKKKNYHDLHGMQMVQEYDTIKVGRPLLNLRKEQIIQYAIESNIPFVYDSTPKTSERGRIRDGVLPSIIDYDMNLYEGFFALANNFKEIYQIYEKIIPKIEKKEDHIQIENKDIFFFDYWKRIFYILHREYGIEIIRNKSIHHFITMVKKNKNGKFVLNHNTMIELKNNLFYITKI